MEIETSSLDGHHAGLVCVIDFANYPFIRRFAGYLNAQHSCAYLYHSGFQSPNQGQREQKTWEYPISSDRAFAKQNLVKRWFQERAWAREAAAVLNDLRPKLVIVTNAPLEVVAVIQKWCDVNGTPFVFWLQDVHSAAIAGALRGKLPVVGEIVVRHYRRMERRLLSNSDRILLIAEDHYVALEELGVPLNRARVLPNWSTIEDLPSGVGAAANKPKEQVWRQENGLVDKRILMYSGTLGMKHDAGVFADLAKACADDPSVAVVIISSGPFADQLKSLASERELSNLYVLPFVDYSMIAITLQSAEILLAILEPEASQFSVPSKILTYACAGRPVVVAMPEENAAARLIREVGFGTVTPPRDNAAFVAAVRALLDQPQTGADAGRRGRAYAEQNFPMAVIEGRFRAVMSGLMP